MYRRDLTAACVSSFSNDAANTGHFTNKVKYVNDDGSIEEFYALAKSGKKGSSNAGNTAAAAGKLTCDGLIEKMNAYAADYQKALLDAIKEQCASDTAKAKVAEYIKKYEEKDDLTDEEKKDYEKLKAARDSGDYTQATAKGGLECAKFKELAITPEPTNPDPSTDPSGGNKNATDPLEEACYQHAKSLGWIICPMIFGLREVAESIYEFIEPLIQVNKSIVSQLGDQNSNLFKAWNTFRGFANIIFVILFLFVIFSQLTGYGIDNYGIKKMLPKLIITAILVNLSFVIAGVAVDISNIAGMGIKGLFEQLGNSSLGSTAIEAQSHIVGEVVSWLSITAAATSLGFILQGWAIIIPILLFLLTTIISIIFALIVLGLRQAFVIILIVLAPIAFACSVLPNTEKIFNKWLEAFKGVLMVYPIVGGLIGAGFFTASLIYTGSQDGTGFIMTIVAGLLSVIPYFLIPSLTRKSLDAMGKAGDRLSSLGRGLGDRATKGINNTQAVKNAKSDSTSARAQARAARYMNSNRARRVEEDLKAGRNVSLRRANRYQRAASLANSGRQAQIGARSAESQYNRLQSDTGFNAAMSAATRAEEDTEMKNYETLIENGDYAFSGGKVNFQENSDIEAALTEELLKGESADVNKIRALQNTLNRKGDKGRSAIYDAMANAQQKAATGGGSVSDNAVKAFSSNIMNNQGDYKASHRSLYEYAKQTASTGRAVGENGRDLGNSINGLTNNGASGIQALTADSFLNTDATQMKKYLTAYKNGNLDAADRAKLESVAHSIANNPNVHNKIRTDDYAEALRTFDPTTDWDSVFRGEGGVKIDHGATGGGASSAPTPITAPNLPTGSNAEVERAIQQHNNGGGRETDSGIWLPS